MENSDSNDKGSGFAAWCSSQSDQLAREEAFYRFVNQQSEEDYRFMRENDLLGIPGESTEEDLLRRPQQIKEDVPPQNSDRGGSPDDVSNDDSRIDWLISFDQNEDTTGSPERENQPQRAMSPTNPNNGDSQFNLKVNFNLNNGSLNPKNEYPSSESPSRGENMENSLRHVENARLESTTARRLTFAQCVTEAFTEVPLNRGQKRARIGSPDHQGSPDLQRTRLRVDSSSPLYTMSEISPRTHHSISPHTFERPLMSETERFSRIHHHESLRQQITGPELQMWGHFATSETGTASQEASSTETTSNDKSEQRNSTIVFVPEVRRVHPGDLWQRDNTAGRTPLISPTNSTLVFDTEVRRVHSGDYWLGDSTAGRTPSISPTNSTLLFDPEVRRAHPGDYWLRDITAGRTPLISPTNSTLLFDPEVRRVHPGDYWLRDITAGRTPLMSPTPYMFTHESEQGGFKHMLSRPELEDASSYVSTTRVPIPIFSNTSLSDTISVATHGTLRHVMTGCCEYNYLRHSDGDVEPNDLDPSENMERSELQNGRDGSDTSSCVHSNSDPRYSSSPFSTITSISISSYISSISSSPISISSSTSISSSYSGSISSSSSSFSYAVARTRSEMFEVSNERRASSGIASEDEQEHQQISPIISDDEPGLFELDQFLFLNEDDLPTGLTKEQIDNLAIRSFSKNDALKVCSVCITEYTEGNKIRTLPCFHEYHAHCIDRWLSENSTCPICRGKVIDSDNRGNF
ncbi:E3 ubiquitin-protein ligase RLIM-like [Tamandua tetradactyla]|uniref:E3 ubiquitin-protein ligase RLIM-like n=1 Tax=Tamandua tetradactyla TaxID=48850 RepID=UPI00405451B7